MRQSCVIRLWTGLIISVVVRHYNRVSYSITTDLNILSAHKNADISVYREINGNKI